MVLDCEADRGPGGGNRSGRVSIKEGYWRRKNQEKVTDPRLDSTRSPGRMTERQSQQYGESPTLHYLEPEKKSKPELTL